jgi:hypothetical protein
MSHRAGSKAGALKPDEDIELHLSVLPIVDRVRPGIWPTSE